MASTAITPKLPTYQTSAAALEGVTGSGIKLAAWTVARTIMIAPPMLVVGVPAKQAWGGAALASGLISLFTVLRIYNSHKEQYDEALQGARAPKRRATPRRSPRRRRR